MVGDNANKKYKCPVCKQLLSTEQSKSPKGNLDEVRAPKKELVDRAIHMIPPGIFFRTQRYICLNKNCSAYFPKSKRKFKIGLIGNVINASIFDSARYSK